ncbi:MAG: alkaline phosphatase [Phocaeicola sp.]
MKKGLLYLTGFALLVCFVLFLTPVDQTPTTGMKNPPKHLIIIGFDGLSSWAINNGAQMPTLRKLMKEGAHTLETRTVLPSSSAVNWASMFMGAGPELHGYTTWGSKSPDLPARVLTENERFPDAFAAIHKKLPEAKMGYFYEWDGMRYLVDSLSFDRFEHGKLTLDGGLKNAIDYITTTRPTLCAIIYDEPDGVGHRSGWESSEYMARIAELDQSIEAVLTAVQKAGMMDETIIMVVSDHGGIETGHGKISMKEMQIPSVFYGKGIKSGHYMDESTMIYDTAPTIAHIFDAEPAQVWVGRPMLSIFE